MDLQILPSARKHGIDDNDMLHAARNPIAFHALPDDLTMVVGASHDGVLLEVGINARLQIVHAMRARRRFLP
ncbi:MAG: hypothetical protein KDA97_02805 [Acidimicrobiales bacterium]|nr:hypothetical protein [Acidimicrobiales bacterium]